jgi:hypothetical protein
MIEQPMTTNQIEDHAGLFQDQALQTGAVYEVDERMVPHPDYAFAALMCGIEAASVSFDAPGRDPRLALLGGLRVIAGLLTSDRRPMYAPGVVLPDTTRGVRIGLLLGPDIIAPSALGDAVTRPLSDIQQRLLDDVAAKHLPRVGEHTVAGVNIADVGHAALIAVTPPEAIEQLHSTVHHFVAGGLSQRLAESGAMNIRVGHSIRKVQERIIPAATTGRLIVACAHQLPGPTQLEATTLVAGMALAAVRSQGDWRSQPDISLNAYTLGRQV